MAAVMITKVQNFIGLSSDTKPTDQVPTGSIFYEYDTGLTYIYNGTAWSIK